MTDRHGVGFVDAQGVQCMCDAAFDGWPAFNAHVEEVWLARIDEATDEASDGYGRLYAAARDVADMLATEDTDFSGLASQYPAVHNVGMSIVALREALEEAGPAKPGDLMKDAYVCIISAVPAAYRRYADAPNKVAAHLNAVLHDRMVQWCLRYQKRHGIPDQGLEYIGDPARLR